MSATNRHTQDAIQLPVAVYLDTSILDGLPETLESGELSALTNIADRVFVPDIVAREWCQHRSQRAGKEAESLVKASRYLSQYAKDWFAVQLPQTHDIDQRVRSVAIRRIKAAGLRILPPPSIDKRDIVRRATTWVPPFREGGRGLKDELVLLGILHHLGRRGFRSAILLSKDADLRSVNLDQRFSRVGVTPRVVDSIPDAMSLVEAVLDATERQAIEEVNQSARQFVEQHWERIKAFVEERATSDGIDEYEITDIWDRRVGGQADIRRLLEVLPRAIADVTVGRKQPGTDRSLMTINVACDFLVEVETDDLTYTALVGPRLRKGQEKEWPSRGPRTSNVTTIRKPLRCNATAIRNERGEWSDLRLLSGAEYGIIAIQLSDDSASTY